jgi:hypothetical protein
VAVVSVEGQSLWRAFHRLPHALYKNDPNWVAPLTIERKIHFDTKHNPFFRHAKGAFWLAMRDGVPVGRITAQIDALHLECHRDATGHFGFIESVDDPAVFAALLETAEAWLRAEGMRRSVGPVSFSMWDEPGLLVEGFDKPPNVLMGHALPYYQGRIEELGYGQVQDLLAYEYQVQQPYRDGFRRLLERARQKHKFVFRPIRQDRRSLPAEFALIRDLLNDAWADNWGFVPMTEAEVEDIALLLKLVLRPEAITIAEYDGEAVGFGMVLPNVNEMIRDLHGRLFPLGIVKLLWRLKFARSRSGRVALMGVRRKWQDSAIGAMAALQIIEETRKGGYGRHFLNVELSWILDTNERIKHVMNTLGAKVVKRYRIYEKTLGSGA